MLLDQFGDKIPTIEVRLSVGFVKKEVLNDQAYDVNAPSLPQTYYRQDHKPIMFKHMESA